MTGATITHAVLRFFVNSVTTGGTIDIFKVTAGAWNEKTLTWNTQPTLASQPANSVLLSAGTAGSYVNVDITSVVKGWLSNPGTSLGLALRARVNSGTRLSLDSKKTTATSHPMTLEVAVAGPAGPANPNILTGPTNTAVGVNTFVANTTGYNDTAIGASALQSNTTGFDNTAVGNAALTANTTGTSNTAVGYAALLHNTTGFDNTAVGNAALQDNTGNNNVAVGFVALQHNTTGVDNTAVGAYALQNNTTGGEGNTALGTFALSQNTTGTGNTAVGIDALNNNTTGTGNTAVGIDALNNNTTGFNNTAVGFIALQHHTTGVNNIAIGNSAGVSLTSGDNNIYLGNPGQPTEAGIIRIGTPGTHTSTFLAGNVFASSFTPSDARLKTDITPLTHVLEKLERLRGVSFTWNDAAGPVTGHTVGQRDIGVIAQEVEAVFPELVTTWGADGYKAVGYEKLTSVLLTAVKEAKAVMDTQQRQLDAQALAELQTQNAALEARLERLEALAARAVTLASR